MISLYRNQIVGADDPALVWYFTDGSTGLLADPDSMDYRIVVLNDPLEQVLPEVEMWQELDIDANKLSIGRYVLPWSVPSDADIDYAYRVYVRWVMGGVTKTAWQDIGVNDMDYGLSNECCCLMCDLTLSGIDLSSIRNKMRAASLIQRMSQYIRNITDRSFHPEYKTIKLDSISNDTLMLREPIIGIESMVLPELLDFEVDAGSMAIYSRHLTDNLKDPDDRDVPMIYMENGIRGGSQNIELTGVFGYTDPDGTCFGKVPDLIRDACVQLVWRDMPGLMDQSEQNDRRREGFITSEKTSTQSYTMDSSVVPSGVTGIGDVDTILSMYCAPFSVSVA